MIWFHSIQIKFLIKIISNNLITQINCTCIYIYLIWFNLIYVFVFVVIFIFFSSISDCDSFLCRWKGFQLWLGCLHIIPYAFYPNHAYNFNRTDRDTGHMALCGHKVIRLLETSYNSNWMYCLWFYIYVYMYVFIVSLHVHTNMCSSIIMIDNCVSGFFLFFWHNFWKT